MVLEPLHCRKSVDKSRPFSYVHHRSKINGHGIRAISRSKISGHGIKVSGQVSTLE